ncbi:MAG: hypothetical protein HYU48_01565 [Candidatus Levybacteria bacterium]|nr:hypothetical protein [Candidatus Levybacteria bacterium]
MDKENLPAVETTELGIDPRNAWAIIPLDRQEGLRQALFNIARTRIEALNSSRHLPLP